MNLPTIAVSDEWYARAVEVMTPPTQVLAKGTTQYVNGVAPKFIQRAEGATVWDVDGNAFLDYSMAVGPISLGYRHPEVDAAIHSQLDEGITFSLVHPLEVEVSELLTRVIPSAEAVRFAKSGAEATSAAVRLARAATGRERVVTCGYHGWHDWYIGTLPRNAGVPAAVRDLVSTFAYNDLESLRSAVDEETAAVILEPMTFEHPQPGFLEGVVDIAHARGALVIFDEIWTGFRWAVGGAQQAYGVLPDLTTVSKGMGNGMPIAALVGRRDLMEFLVDDVFFFSTFGGETLSLAASKRTIEIMIRDDVPAMLAASGQRLMEGFDAACRQAGMESIVSCVGHPARSLVVFHPLGGDPLLQKSFVQQELIRRGILWSGFHIICAAHTVADIDRTVEAYAEVLIELAEAISTGTLSERILGTPVQPVFRRTVGFDTKPRAVR